MGITDLKIKDETIRESLKSKFNTVEAKKYVIKVEAAAPKP